MRYIVMTRSAQMPSSCWGKYERVALVEVEPGYGKYNEPKMISSRARGIVRVLKDWDRLHAGRPGRGNTAADKARRELQEIANRLNTQRIAILTANL